MPRLCLDVPDSIAGIFDVAAAKAHAPRDAYMRLCMLTGLAEQMRLNGHGAVANEIADLAKEMMRKHPEARTGTMLVRLADDD